MLSPLAETHPLKQQDVSALINYLTGLSPSSNKRIEIILALRPLLQKPQVAEAQSLVDLVDCTLVAVGSDTGLFPKLLLRILRDVCSCWELLPSSYILQKELNNKYDVPTNREGSKDVWEGTYMEEAVAIKTLRKPARGDMIKKYFKEVVLLKQLPHPNIVPFLGIPTSTSGFQLSMVFPWMEHGNVSKYLCDNPDTIRHPLLIDIGDGIKFLHSLDIVHGDLRGANILVNSGGRACLTGFGSASIRGDHEMNNDPAEASCPRAVSRWMAPELSDGRTSKAGDVYAMAMVMIEICSGRLPFYECPAEAVPFRVTLGKRPGRPEQGVSDKLWELVEMCWRQDWTQRPTISFVLGWLREASP